MTAHDDDLPPEAADSQPLATAYRAHADRKLVAEHLRLEDELERVGQWHYVGNPRNPEYYVLNEFDTRGQQLLQDKRNTLKQIAAGFMAKLREGRLTAWAREGSPLAPWRTIPASAWQILKLDDERKGTATAPGVMLFDIRVGVSVATKVPEHVPAPPLPETGAPGRPSNMHLILAEFERRVQGGLLEPSLARQAATLVAWFTTNHPDKQPATAKTIENKIRSHYKAAKASST